METLITNTLNVYIFIFLFPGLLMAIGYRYVATGRMYSVPLLLIYSSIFSVVNIITACFIVYLLYDVDLIEDIGNSFVNNGNITDVFKNYRTLTLGKFIKIVYVFSVPIGVTLIKILDTFIRNKNLYYWLIKFHLTSRYDISVWDDFLSSNNWVLVRDFDNNFAYYGVAHFYSEEELPRELYLRKVQVKDNETLETLYEMESVYLYLENRNVVIESKKVTIDNRIERIIKPFYEKEITNRPEINKMKTNIVKRIKAFWS